jgi:HEAT repeat protein
MNKIIFPTLVSVSLNFFVIGQNQASDTKPKNYEEALQIVQQMHGFSMQMSAVARSDGRIDPIDKKRADIYLRLRAHGKAAVLALANAFSDPDVQLRRNAALVLIDLSGRYSRGSPPKVDTRPAMPALIKATSDIDGDVRAWAAHALAEIGPDAKVAIPDLIRLLKDPMEGPRNTSCIALGRIGPAAKTAIPSLHEALNDPSKDVRQLARVAIGKIQQK